MLKIFAKVKAVQNHDLSGIKPKDQENAFAAIIESAKEYSFDFEQPLPLQISLATLSPSLHILLL
ncbi:MAG: hypothetical protein AAFX80_08055, partial [Cyanobacteria bacterium J06639_18]